MSRVIIDVRSKLEYKMGHVKEAINIPVQSLQGHAKLESVTTNDEVIVYCASGARSAMAAQILQSQGYKNVVNGINKAQTERLTAR